MLAGLLAACGGGDNTVADPNVVGQSQTAATTAITGASLMLGTVTMQSSATVAAGLVISQSPAGGSSVAKGSGVNLVVSSGPALVAAPSVVGDTQAAATTALTGAGLTAGTITMASSTTVAPGKVISEAPAGGSNVVSGSAVNLVVSSGVTFGGVAASGYPVAAGPGYALDAVTGTEIPFTTDASGNYSVDVFGYTGPFLIHVLALTAGATPVSIYSIATTGSAGTIVNVTPLSDVVLAYASGVTTQNLETACTANQSACPALLTGILASLAGANTAIVNAIPASVWSAFGITPGSFNALTTLFAATHTGLDGLLDALVIAPPSTGGGSYTITLQGATPQLLATIPTSGTPGTQGAAPAAGAAPSATAVTQAQNLTAVQGEIQTLFTKITALFATAQPAAGQVSPFLTSNFLNDGDNATQFAALFAGQPQGTVITGGGVAGYSGAPFSGSSPLPAVTYDVNNCVTSVWVYHSGSANSLLLTDTIPTSNAAGVCTGGNWLVAGDQHVYTSELFPRFYKSVSTLAGGTVTYLTKFQLSNDSSQSTGNPGYAGVPYNYIAITGPGITTIGAPTAASGTVLLLAPQPVTAPAVLSPASGITFAPNYVTYDPYYGGGGSLSSCAVILAGSNTNYTSATPCFNANAIAGSNYVINFVNVNLMSAVPTILSTQEQRLNITIGSVSLPTTYYPKITGVTPSSAASVAAGTATSVVTTWTLAAGSTSDSQGASLSAANGTLLFTFENNVSPTATTNTISVPSLLVAPATGGVHVNTIIGGLAVTEATSF